jgi:vitamin B12 transporter
MNIWFPAPLKRRSFIPVVAATLAAFLMVAAGLMAAEAGEESVPLGPIVVTATRTPLPAGVLGSSVDFVSGEELAREQIGSLRAALGGTAGVPLFATGAGGAATSLFLRGANSNQTLFLVDGLRLNDANTDYAVFLGGAGLTGTDSLEIIRGPQSTLYGSEAMGGVVAVRTRQGEGAPSAQLSVEGGSFGTERGSIEAQGARNQWAYHLAVEGNHTDNQRANNSFTGTTYVVRLDRQVDARLAVGATLRGFAGAYGSPGDRFTNDPDNREREQNQLATIFADYTLSPVWSGRVILGGQDRRLVSENPTPGQPTQITHVQNRRGVLDWQNTVKSGDRNRLTAGATAERSHTRNDGFGDINRRDNLLAFFAEDEWTPADRVYLTAGLRSDDHDTSGRATTWRTTAAWRPIPGRLKLRASYGTAFRSPGFLDLYGQSAYYVGNPGLNPEHARGWDAGVDLDWPRSGGSVSATWFDTEFRDLIVYDFSQFPGTTANVDRARTRGLELSARQHLAGTFETRLAYTYLEAENLTQHTRLLRRPRHSVSADLWHNLGRGFSVGAGVLGVARRQDVDPLTFATVDGRDYAVARLYAAWAASARLSVRLRIENLLDAHYEEVLGYPAAGAGVFAGVELKL